jgi:hypothetical protein
VLLKSALLTVLIMARAAWAQGLPLPEGPVTTFGVTVVDAYGLHGEIYLLKPGSQSLPNFKKMKPVGSIYTYALNIPARDFTEGFPGITDRNEWFAIDYNGSFWIDSPGRYEFLLASDDGSKLLIDGKTVIDNDGTHPLLTKPGSVALTGGFHKIRVEYFQGPRMHLALVLAVSGPGDHDFRVFSTHEFRPPGNPDTWKYDNPKK